MTPPNAEDIFFEARGLPAPAREAFVDEACREDPALRSEVLALLAADAGADAAKFLTGCDAKDPALPHAVGPYRIVRELGRGGQAVVYLAHDDELDRPIALKVLRKLFVDGASTLVRRFRREATAMASLEHPGLCTVYDMGVDDGVAWIAMRYVEGETLADLVARDDASTGLGLPTGSSPTPTPNPETAPGPGTSTPRSRSRLLRFFEQAARALHVAHEQGLVHRDVKPGNLMVSESGEPVLLDFGIAHAVDATDVGGLTRTTDVLGTPAYLAPELLRGQPESIDRSVDVYGLGVTMYECLTGRRPFESVTRDGLYQQILTTEPVPPRRIDPRIPRDLEVVVLTAMEKHSGRRYQSAEELADELRRVREHEPIRARPLSPIGRTLRWARRQPAIAASLTLAFLALSIGLALSLSFWLQSEERRQALEDRDAQLRMREHADALRDAEALLEAGSAEAAAKKLSRLEIDGFARRYVAQQAMQQVPRRIPREASLMECLDWSRDGRHSLLVEPVQGEPAGKVSVRSWPEGQVVSEFERRSLGLFTARFDASGRRVLILGADAEGSLELVDLGTGETRRRRKLGARIGPLRHGQGSVWAGHIPGAFGCAAFPRGSGTALVIGGLDGSLHRFDPGTLEPMPALPQYARPASAIQFVRYGPKGERLLVGDSEGSVRVLDATSGTTQWTFDVCPERRPFGGALDADIDPDGKWLIGTGAGGQVSVFDLRSGTRIRHLMAHVQSNSDLCWGLTTRFCPGAPIALSAGHDNQARLYSTESWQLIATLSAIAAQFVDEGTVVVGLDSNGVDLRWKLPDLLPATLGGFPQALTGLSITPDARHVFTVNVGPQHRRGLRKWELETGKQVLARLGEDFEPLSVDVSQDGEQVAVGCADQRVLLFDANSGRLERELRAPDGWIEEPAVNRPAIGFVRVRFSPDSKGIAAGLGTTDMSRDAKVPTPVVLFDVRTSVARRFDGISSTVFGLDFDRSGERLAASGLFASERTQGVLIWGVSDGRRLGSFAEPSGHVVDLAFSKTDDALAVAGDTAGRGLLLELDTNYRVRWRLAGRGRPNSTIRRLAYLHGGQQLVTVDGNRELGVWHLATQQRLLTAAVAQTAGAQAVPYALEVSPGSDRVLIGTLGAKHVEVFECSRQDGAATSRTLHASAAERVDEQMLEHGAADRVRVALEGIEEPALRDAALGALEGMRGFAWTQIQNSAQYHLNHGRDEMARQRYLQALALESQLPMARLRLAQLASFRFDAETARTHLELAMAPVREALRADPNARLPGKQSSVLYLASSVWSRLGDWDRTQAALEELRASKRYGSTSTALNNEGFARLRFNDLDAAQSLIARSNVPEKLGRFLSLIHVELRRGDFRAAHALASSMSEQWPSNRRVRFTIATTQALCGRELTPNAARMAIEDARILLRTGRPGVASWYLHFARALAAGGNESEALSLLAELTERWAQAPFAWEQRARFLATRDPALAELCARKAVELSNGNSPRLRASLAEVLFASGQKQPAIAEAERALREMPPHGRGVHGLSNAELEQRLARYRQGS